MVKILRQSTNEYAPSTPLPPRAHAYVSALVYTTLLWCNGHKILKKHKYSRHRKLAKTPFKSGSPDQQSVGGGGKGGCTHVRHVRSRMTIHPRIPTYNVGTKHVRFSCEHQERVGWGEAKAHMHNILHRPARRFYLCTDETLFEVRVDHP